MSKYTIQCWTDPRLGGPHVYYFADTMKAAKRCLTQAKRENPTSHCEIVKEENRGPKRMSR